MNQLEFIEIHCGREECESGGATFHLRRVELELNPDGYPCSACSRPMRANGALADVVYPDAVEKLARMKRRRIIRRR